MNSLLRGFGSGFGRVFGRILAYLFIGLVLYLLFTYLDIDIVSIIKKFRGFILL